MFLLILQIKMQTKLLSIYTRDFRIKKQINEFLKFLTFHLSVLIFNHFSKIIVTGPSFISFTFISAPNIPFSTLIPFFWHSLQKYSYSSLA